MPGPAKGYLLDPRRVQRVRELRAEGLSIRAVSRESGVPRSTVADLVRGQLVRRERECRTCGRAFSFEVERGMGRLPLYCSEFCQRAGRAAVRLARRRRAA